MKNKNAKIFSKELRALCIEFSKLEFLQSGPFISTDGNSYISWSNYKQGIHKGSYREIYNKTLEDSQYSFAISKISFTQDDSIIELIPEEPNSDSDLVAQPGLFQFYVLFVENVLTECRYAFYPSPEISDGFLRIDIDKNGSGNLEHSKCHMQISTLNDLRIPLCKLPSPKVFIEFCLRFYFYELWIKLKDSLFKPNVELESLFEDKTSEVGIFLSTNRFNTSQLRGKTSK